MQIYREVACWLLEPKSQIHLIVSQGIWWHKSVIIRLLLASAIRCPTPEGQLPKEKKERENTVISILSEYKAEVKVRRRKQCDKGLKMVEGSWWILGMGPQGKSEHLSKRQLGLMHVVYLLYLSAWLQPGRLWSFVFLFCFRACDSLLSYLHGDSSSHFGPKRHGKLPYSLTTRQSNPASSSTLFPFKSLVLLQHLNLIRSLSHAYYLHHIIYVKYIWPMSICPTTPLYFSFSFLFWKLEAY